jgi:3-dehydroquinate dehydratase-2
MKILIINGPNLNLLGLREPEIYGAKTLADLESELENEFENKADLEFFQSNHEGEIISKIQGFREDGIVINAGAYTHTSIAILDVLTFAKSNGVKIVEVHISNIYKREDFRRKSYISPVCEAVICGCGFQGYKYAILEIIK